MSSHRFLLSCGAAFGVLLGCSVLRDLSVEQCKTDGDCSRFGDYTCSSDKVCVAREMVSGAAGSNVGGSGNTGVSGSATMSDAGAAGAPEALECTTNADCIDAHEGGPYICRQNACVSLTSDECPFVVAGPEESPTEYLTKPGKPIVFGAYVPIDASNPEGHPYTLNYKFALEEFMQGTLGGVGSPARPFVMVLCQSTKPDLKASVSHLVDTVRVPAILTTLPSSDMKTVFDEVSASGKKVFLLGALEADSALAAAEDQGRMWHMLGPATDLIPAYVPLLGLAETYVHRFIKQDDSAPTPLKVAVVYSDLTYSIDMANALQSKAVINGHPLNAKENKDYYQRFQVQVTGADGPNVSSVVTSLSPSGSADIIVSLGGAEFISSILPKIQESRSSVLASPFYVLSPRNAFDRNLTAGSFFLGTGRTYLDKVTVGVNYASVEDSSLYDQYLQAIKGRYPGQDGLESRENLYDAAYFMLYSLAAASFASGDDFDGDDVVNGMKALVDGSTPATVGPGDNGEMFSKVLTTLKTGGKVALTGTLGPPDFNPLTGARNSPGSVWCINQKPDTVHFDQLRLDPKAPTMLKLSGAKFCFDNFVP